MPRKMGIMPKFLIK